MVTQGADDSAFDRCLDRMIHGEMLDGAESLAGLNEDERAAIKRLQGLLLEKADTPAAPAELGNEHDFGDFRILRTIGRGGMGIVYLAEQVSLGRLCALKTMRSELLHSPTSRERFRREALAAARIVHPHVVPVFAAGEAEGRSFIAMGFVPGRSLEEVIATHRGRGEPIETQRAVRWGRQIASGLAAAHNMGIIHRDVKPANILIDSHDRAMLTDFGLAKRLESDDVSMTQSFAGSPRYAAPEQIHRATPIDVRTDVYGLGVTLYEVFTLEPAFAQASIESLSRAIVETQPLRARGLHPSLPHDIETIVHKCLEKRPRDRFGDAVDLEDELGRYSNSLPLRSRRPSLWGRIVRWRRRKPELAAVASLACVAILVVAGIALGHSWLEERDQARRAGELITDAQRRIAEYAAQRIPYEQRRWDSYGLESELQSRALAPEEVARLEVTRREFKRLRGERLVALERVSEDIRLAEDLGADPNSIADAWAGLYYEQWLDLRNERGNPLGRHYHALFERYAKHERWSELIRDSSKFQLATEPPGADVWIFRYRYQDELAEVWPHAPWLGQAREHRLVACPYQASVPQILPGSAALEVVRDSGQLERGDFVVTRDGVPVDEENSADWGTPSVVSVVRGERVLELEAPGELTFQLTLCAPFREPDCRFGPTPIRDLEVETGWYVALIASPDHAPARYSFHVDFHADPYHSPGHADGRVVLHPADEADDEFRRVTSDSYETGGHPEYEMMRLEVTCADYLRFLQALAPSERVTRAPKSADGSELWMKNPDNNYQLPTGVDLRTPVTGVCWSDATAYADWRTLTDRTGVWEYALPSSEDWRRACFGGDARLFVFGDDFRPDWVQGRFQSHVPRVAAVGSHPRDESIYGHRDMAANVAEWGHREAAAESRRAEVHGGSWADAATSAFRNDALRHLDVATRENWLGFRLVRRRRTDAK